MLNEANQAVGLTQPACYTGLPASYWHVSTAQTCPDLSVREGIGATFKQSSTHPVHFIELACRGPRPYTDFVHQQIAGDLLPHDSFLDRDANLIATGMLAIGPKSLNRHGTRGTHWPAQERQKIILYITNQLSFASITK